jgi:hypothetical protein
VTWNAKAAADWFRRQIDDDSDTAAVARVLCAMQGGPEAVCATRRTLCDFFRAMNEPVPDDIATEDA